MKIAIGADHAGFDYKEKLVPFLTSQGFEVEDFGTFSTASVDYPDFAHPLATSVEGGENELGILICGSGNGVALTANKHQGIRAGLCWLDELGALARQHNNANVLCMGARVIGPELAFRIADTFLDSKFSNDERHIRRISMLED